MDAKTLTNLALASRVGFGLASIVAPRAAFRPFGARLPEDAAVRYVTRLFGSRDVALGVLGLAADGAARRGLLGVLCATDTIDCVSALRAGRKGAEVSRLGSAALVLGGLIVLVPQLNELRRND